MGIHRTACGEAKHLHAGNFRDHYFEHNSTDKALLKNQETQEKLKETLNILDYVQGDGNLFLSVSCVHNM